MQFGPRLPPPNIGAQSASATHVMSAMVHSKTHRTTKGVTNEATTAVREASRSAARCAGHPLTMSTDPSRVDLRRAMRALPSKRRRAVVRAVRDGRAVDDPRDARVAVMWAQRAQAAWWPRWLLPQERPRGRRALLWLLHAGWVPAAMVIGIVIPVWRGGGTLRWIVLGAFAYSVVAMPWLFALVLRTRWNAPQAERRNREVLGQSSDQ